MASPVDAEEVRRAVESALASKELTVTKIDIGEVKGLIGDVKSDIGKVETRIYFVLAGIGVLLTLLLSTYGATAFFTWRLINTIVSAD